MGSLSVPHIQRTTKIQIRIIMFLTKSLPAIMFVLLPFCLSVPIFSSSKDQVRKCFSGFFRCCSSTKTIPQRCFEINQCVLTFFTLERYNEICSNIYNDTNDKSMEKIDINSQRKMLKIEEVMENTIEKVVEDVMEKIKKKEELKVET